MLHGFVLKNLEREGLVSSTSFHFDDVESVVVDGLFDCRSSVLDVAELTFLGAQRLSFLPGALEIFLSKFQDFVARRFVGNDNVEVHDPATLLRHVSVINRDSHIYVSFLAMT
jgi:hypothetical protein